MPELTKKHKIPDLIWCHYSAKMFNLCRIAQNVRSVFLTVANDYYANYIYRPCILLNVVYWCQVVLFRMVYHCAAAQCSSHDAKRARPDVYPWMQEVTWVKFPKDPARLARWKRLLRRGGKSKENVVDKFIVDRYTRLCSRHFDCSDIVDGTAKCDPKYFTWNNWGKPTKTRSVFILIDITVNCNFSRVSVSVVYRWAFGPWGGLGKPVCPSPLTFLSSILLTKRKLHLISPFALLPLDLD